MQNLAINYEVQRDFDSANKVLDRALSVDPTAFGCWEIRGKVALEQNGDLSVADKILAKADGMRLSPEIQSKLATGRASLFLLRRQFDAAVREAEKIPDATLSSYPGAVCGKYSAIGAAKRGLGDEAGAREAFTRAKRDAEELLKQNPGQANAIATLAEMQAWLGEKDAALAGIKQAQEIVPLTKDAFGGMEINQMAAEIYTILGDTDQALATLDEMLQKPSPVTVQTLKMNPMWDPLRKDPRFQAMLDKYGAKV